MKTHRESADPWDVVVVGAGPTGLLLAGELAAQGLRVAVLERDLERDPTPKGNGIVGRASVELAKRGVFAGTDFKAIRPPRFQFGPIPLRLGLWPASPLHILPIPQRRLEELLERRAVQRGADLRRGHVVLGIQQTESRVEAEVLGGDRPHRMLARYVLRASLHRVLGADLPFTDATAMRTTVGNSRIASTYRAGRVLLAGDAAHIFNTGGSSLNAGLLDALELASHLTAALRGGSPEDIDAYEKARRPAGLRTLSHTRVQAALSRDDGNATALREIMGHLVATRGAARRLAGLIENP